MQRWEYLTINVGEDAWSDSLGRKGKLRFFEPATFLNELGNEGWELIESYSRSGWDFYKMFLKRPKP